MSDRKVVSIKPEEDITQIIDELRRIRYEKEVLMSQLDDKDRILADRMEEYQTKIQKLQPKPEVVVKEVVKEIPVETIREVEVVKEIPVETVREVEVVKEIVKADPNQISRELYEGILQENGRLKQQIADLVRDNEKLKEPRPVEQEIEQLRLENDRVHERYLRENKKVQQLEQAIQENIHVKRAQEITSDERNKARDELNQLKKDIDYLKRIHPLKALLKAKDAELNRLKETLKIIPRKSREYQMTAGLLKAHIRERDQIMEIVKATFQQIDKREKKVQKTEKSLEETTDILMQQLFQGQNTPLER